MLKRSLPLPLLLLTLALAGCGAGVSAGTSPTPVPTQPTQPSVTIPSGALMKYLVPGTTHYAFNASVMLTPPTGAGTDASVMIQTAIDAMACATLSKGGAIFLAPGTYTLAHTLKIHGSGVTLVGVRAVTVTGQDGAYPTLTYGDNLTDSDYDTRSATNCGTTYTFSALSAPAAIRFNGNYNYAASGVFSFGGLIGVNIAYTGTAGSGSEGDRATALAVNLPHQALFRDISISNAWNGVDVGSSTSPYFRNISITGLRGSVGARLGASNSAAFKMHELTVTAATSNTTATLVIMPQDGELVGALLTGGGVGISITGPDTTAFADDIYIRSVQIEHPSKQGILLQYAQGTYINDVTVDSAGAEAVKVLPGFYGGLAITNLTATNSGLSAVRVQQGMNIDLVNAQLLNSGQNKASAGPADLPIADLSIDSSVTSFNVVGGRFGSVDGAVVHEDYGVYVSPSAPAYAPWHMPILIASNIDFLNIPSAHQSAGIAVANVSDYSTLSSAGYFNPPAEDGWTTTQLTNDPVGSGVFSVVKGFNTYDLPEIDNAPWIDLTSTAFTTSPVVDSSGNISAINFSYWETVAAAEFTAGFVFYLPAGHFTSGFTTWTREIYSLPGTLSITVPGMQFLGDGRNVTLITNTGNEQSSSIVLGSGSADSGVFGLSVYDSLATAEPTTVPSATQYAPPFLVQNTSQVRLANVGAKYSIGGGVSIVDTKNSELFDVDMTSIGVNNSQPTVPLAGYQVTATSNESASDIRFYQVYGEFLQNIYDPGYTSSTTPPWCDGSSACGLDQTSIPEFTWIRLVGGVLHFRNDYGTYIEGKNGWQTVSNGSGLPHELSSFKYAADHLYAYGVDLQQATDVDLIEPWIDTRVTHYFVESGVTGNVRISTAIMRGGALEGARIEGGSTVSLVNCQIGNDGVLWAPYNTEQTRPLAGVFLGSRAGATTFVGGMNGWIADANYASAMTNNNRTAYGIVLGTGTSAGIYTIVGMDLYGNWAGSTLTGTGCTIGSACVSGRVGRQISGGTTASVLVPNP